MPLNKDIEPNQHPHTHTYLFKLEISNTHGESPHDIVVNVLDCDIVVREFKLQSNYYVLFGTSTLKKGMNPLSPPVMG